MRRAGGLPPRAGRAEGGGGVGGAAVHGPGDGRHGAAAAGLPGVDLPPGGAPLPGGRRLLCLRLFPAMLLHCCNLRVCIYMCVGDSCSHHHPCQTSVRPVALRFQRRPPTPVPLWSLGQARLGGWGRGAGCRQADAVVAAASGLAVKVAGAALGAREQAARPPASEQPEPEAGAPATPAAPRLDKYQGQQDDIVLLSLIIIIIMMRIAHFGMETTECCCQHGECCGRRLLLILL